MKLARIRGCLARLRSEWDPTHPFETSWILSPRRLFACRFLLVGAGHIVFHERTHTAANQALKGRLPVDTQYLGLRSGCQGC
jgi:hypothetical protein